MIYISDHPKNDDEISIYQGNNDFLDYCEADYEFVLPVYSYDDDALFTYQKIVNDLSVHSEGNDKLSVHPEDDDRLAVHSENDDKLSVHSEDDDKLFVNSEDDVQTFCPLRR